MAMLRPGLQTAILDNTGADSSIHKPPVFCQDPDVRRLKVLSIQSRAVHNHKVSLTRTGLGQEQKLGKVFLQNVIENAVSLHENVHF